MTHIHIHFFCTAQKIKRFFQFFFQLQLVGGSAGTEQTDERENAPEGEATVAKNADGYTEGIPGPVTRLFVLANRGLANLIQDLILVHFFTHHFFYFYFFFTFFNSLYESN